MPDFLKEPVRQPVAFKSAERVSAASGFAPPETSSAA
jgi:hypothetical protein